ncbi:MAG TPA: hypothetical protein VFA29_05800 [Candidatus Baltobacteraceae bacterium]|nr:hypothetical protein [Candidatus Baltobacteraceae bacterium]
MLPLFFAAALTAAGAKPLFVPPPGFNHLTRDPALQSRLSGSNSELMAEYRLHARQSVGPVLLSRDVVITITRGYSYGMGSQAYAQTRLQMLQEFRGTAIHADKALPLCNGWGGWLVAYTMPRGDYVYDELYAASGDTAYTVRLYYPKSIGDRGAVRSLSSFCPPGRYVPASALDASVPFTPPAAWSLAGVPDAGAPFSGIGRWMHPSAHSRFLESIALVKSPPLGDGSIAQQSSDIINYQRQSMPNFTLAASRPQRLCGRDDGWYASFTVGQRPNAETYEEVIAYGSEATYVASYDRRAGDPENAAAKRALESLCPRAPAPSASPAATSSSSPSPASSATPR